MTLGQAGHMKELFDVIDIMRSPPKKKFKTGVFKSWDPRLEPDIVVYHAVSCLKKNLVLRCLVVLPWLWDWTHHFECTS